MAQSEKQRLDALVKLAEDAHRFGSIRRHLSDAEFAAIQERCKNEERLLHQEKCGGRVVLKVTRINPKEGFVTEAPACEICGVRYFFHDQSDNFPVIGEQEYWDNQKRFERILRSHYST